MESLVGTRRAKAALLVERDEVEVQLLDRTRVERDDAANGLDAGFLRVQPLAHVFDDEESGAVAHDILA